VIMPVWSNAWQWLLAALAPYPADLMVAVDGSTAVNRAGRSASEMVAPVAG